MRVPALVILAVCTAGITDQSQASPDLARRFSFVAEHDGTFGDHPTHYQSIVENYLLGSNATKPEASVVTFTYIAQSSTPDKPRPVIFSFNGGPGAASIWLHMGLLGPERPSSEDLIPPPTTPPFSLSPNEDSPLDVADIVLIDPPGTGFSRVLADGKTSDFYGVDQDAKATTNVIKQWVQRHRAWNRPRYLLGESYGTIRAVEVARLLGGGPTETGQADGLTLSGIILLGQNLMPSEPADNRDIELLPSFAAVACFYRKEAQNCDPTEQAEEARHYASAVLEAAFFEGDDLPSDRIREIADRLAQLTGLPSSFIVEKHLRISKADFTSKLMSEQKLKLGSYDARFNLPAEPAGDDPVSDDPAMAQYVPSYVAAFDEYLRDILKVDIDEDYHSISFEVNSHWSFNQDGPGLQVTPDYSNDLAIAMRRNPELRLMVGSGLYDLTTPLGSALYMIAHASLPLKHVSLHTYLSGHQSYIGSIARNALANDIRTFVTTARS